MSLRRPSVRPESTGRSKSMSMSGAEPHDLQNVASPPPFGFIAFMIANIGVVACFWLPWALLSFLSPGGWILYVITFVSIHIFVCWRSFDSLSDRPEMRSSCNRNSRTAFVLAHELSRWQFHRVVYATNAIESTHTMGIPWLCTCDGIGKCIYS